MRKYFELNKPYKFDVNDIISAIYVLCAVFGIAGLNVTPLFFFGSLLGAVTCLSARRINIAVLNLALFVLNAVNFYKMIFIER